MVVDPFGHAVIRIAGFDMIESNPSVHVDFIAIPMTKAASPTQKSHIKKGVTADISI